MFSGPGRSGSGPISAKEVIVRQSTGFLKRHSLVIGIVLMFLFTWPIDLANGGLMPFQVPFIVYLFLGWGFGVAAVLMTWLTLGGGAVAALLKRYLQWRVAWKWYLVLLIIPVLQLMGILIHSVLSGIPADFAHVIADQLRPPGFSRLAFVLPFFLTDLIANGEEIGWRGYVLPRLQSRYTALAAALIVGVIWGLWHIPKLITHWSTPYFLALMVDQIAKSVLLAWLYNSTGGSLLLTAMTHAAWNTAGVFIPSATTLSSEDLVPFLITVLLEVIVVALIARAVGSKDLSRTKRRQIEE
jgi:membrane protease YdiL (CAAX protease family)